MYVGPYGTKVVPEMFEYARDMHSLLKQWIHLNNDHKSEHFV